MKILSKNLKFLIGRYNKQKKVIQRQKAKNLLKIYCL